MTDPTASTQHHYDIPATMAGERLDKALSVLDDNLSRTAIKRLIEEGEVLLDGQPVTSPSQKLKGGERVSLGIPPPDLLEGVLPEAIPLAIIYEDHDIIVIDKAAGMTVHPGAGIASGTLVNALLYHCGDLSGIGGVIRPGIVHRLDKETSGLIVAAKHDTAHHHLAEQFRTHSAFRRYLAIVRGVPQHREKTINLPIDRHPQQRQKMAVARRGGREAITHYRVEEQFPPFALLSCRLETGRTHQIRVHLSHSGHPLLGDQVYSNPFHPPLKWDEELRKVIIGFQRQALHATALRLTHPGTEQPMLFEAPPPADFQLLLDTLRKHLKTNS